MAKLYKFVIAALACSSCASVSNEEVGFKKVNIPADAGAPIVTQFTADELSVNHLKAFEQRAIEKLQDLADYLRILSDKSYEDEFRNAALLQAQDLFVDHSQIRLYAENEPDKINSFLMNASSDSIPRTYLFRNIAVKNSLQEAANILYEGSLGFQYGVVENGDTVWYDAESKIAEFYLMKTSKSFGSSEKMIWEVYLGNIF